ncbi:hemolysin activation protein [Shewanella sp. NFH-SH190041]|uniref:ShlB/FhaC/HecB family hemolysin secretion/activation protein n=1 Tax=Shewanella sp. NFH-SH190041 TaxID=2950245 RepID=UPI0021C28EA1|nr:ShlB/FhaC/HecB family hemolysin secretion/activation protein [Shewanella sp. NFH-SH190041]BDM64906.1 hemolysin activation protein [Shewanella sp. NFH-SH190041]
MRSDKLRLLACLVLLGAGNVCGRDFPAQVDKVVDQASSHHFQQNQQQIHHWMQQNQRAELRDSAIATPKKDANPLPKSAQCLALNDVAIRGISLLTPADLQQLTPLDNHCITAAAVNRLIDEITRLYLLKGYITARVLVGGVDPHGQLLLNVVEGHIEKITGDDATHIALLFPHTVGKPLNLRQLEQGIDQANRLSSNHLTMEIVPGDQFGGSIIQLKNNPLSHWHASAVIDNYGQANTGIQRLTLGLGWDDLLGIDDYLNVALTQSLRAPSRGLSRSYNLLYSIPYGFFTLSGFYSASEYGINQQLAYSSVRLSGDSQEFGAKLDYVMFRDQNQIYRSYFQISQKQSNNYFDHDKLAISSFNYSTLELGGSYTRQMRYGSVGANLALEKGLPDWQFHHSGRDAVARLSDFWKFTGGVNFSRWLLLGQANYLFNSSVYGQYSAQPLWGGESLDLADPSAIRGLHINSMSASSGLYWQNTLSRYFDSALGGFTPRIGIDIGQVYFPGSHPANQAALGLSAGVSYSYRQIAADIMLNRALPLGPSRYLPETWQCLVQVSVAL